MSDRQTGITTKQILEAPPRAVFIWCNSHVDYPMRLAKHLNRTDLLIVGPGWLTSNGWHGPIREVVVDHACTFTPREYDELCFVRQRIESHRRNST